MPADNAQIQRLLEVITQLRLHCPWTRELTHEALLEYLYEEADEVAEEVRAQRVGEPLRDELGDVLLQVVLHAAIASERGDFDFNDVAAAISAKLVRRSPHVFDVDGTLNPKDRTVEEIDAEWDRIKATEKND